MRKWRPRKCWTFTASWPEGIQATAPLSTRPSTFYRVLNLAPRDRRILTRLQCKGLWELTGRKDKSAKYNRLPQGAEAGRAQGLLARSLGESVSQNSGCSESAMGESEGKERQKQRGYDA